MVYDLYAHGGGGSKVPVGEIFVGGARTASGTTALTVNTWAHLAATFDGADAAASTSTALSWASRPSPARSPPRAAPCGSAATRIWDEHFAGLIDEVRDLPARADCGGDPGGHERRGREPRRAAADRARRSRRERRRDLGRPDLDGRRRTTSASRGTTSTARRRLASRRAPANRDRAADGDELHRLGPRGGHLLLPRHRRGRGRQPLAAVERGERRRRRHDAAVRTRDVDGDRRDRRGRR